MDSLVSHRPFRTPGPHTQQASIESWHARFSDPTGQKALWLKFQVIVSQNGFTRLGEVSAIYFHRQPHQETQISAFRQIFDIRNYRAQETPEGISILIGGCEFSSRHTRGAIATQGKTFRWDFQIHNSEPSGQFNLIATRHPLSKLGWIEQRAVSPGENLNFVGKTWISTHQMSEQSTEWSHASGMQGHWAGAHLPYSWIWSHCNHFINSSGADTPFVFEGLNGRGRGFFGPTFYPRFRSFYFLYRGEEYAFNSMWDTFRSRSTNTLTEWNFQADRGALSFRGQVKADLKDFAGQSFEDTDGQTIYSSNAQLGQMTLWIYRAGKLEETLRSQGGVAFEIALRKPNPYVPILI